MMILIMAKKAEVKDSTIQHIEWGRNGLLISTAQKNQSKQL